MLSVFSSLKVYSQIHKFLTMLAVYINFCKCTFKSVEAYCFVSEHTSLYVYISPASVTVHSTLNANVKIYIKKSMLSTVVFSSQ